MSYSEMKKVILFRYHKDIGFWYKLVGEMFEGTDGFSNPHKVRRRLDGKFLTVSWDNYDWDITEE